MITCGTQYGVYIEGKVQWFPTYRQAAQSEAEQLSRKVHQKRAAGQTVILTREMGRLLQQTRD